MSAYKQPREDVAPGAVRDDNLLSLEESAVAVRKLLAGLAGVLMKATLVGQPAPIVRRIHERMHDPQPGDLVLETSTMYRHADDWYKGCGILLEHRVEWWETDAEREAQVAEERAAHEDFLRGPYAHPGDADEPWEPDERTTDHAWYIQYGPQPADVCRWVNCDFIAIPTDPRGWDVPAGVREGTATVFTRNSLLGGLADSGFALRQPEEN
jgi:hypothetical protein